MTLLWVVSSLYAGAKYRPPTPPPAPSPSVLHTLEQSPPLECDRFQNQIIKRLWLLSWVLPLPLFGGSQLPCHGAALWRGPLARN